MMPRPLIAGPPAKPLPLTVSESLLLDVVRVGAAMLVAVGHLTQPFFSVGWPNLVPLARFCVAVFFVLSGFVIRYVTCRRRSTFANYLGDRATRIYSVALPALLLTLLLDTISRHHNPAVYASWISDAPHPLGRLLANTLFVAQLWTLQINPLSNGPFWSLNYEVIYYLLYGCAFYLAGRRRTISIALIALFAGPKILLLFPVWLLGALAYDLYQHWIILGSARRILNRLVIGTAALATAGALLLHFSAGAALFFFKARVWLFVESEHLKLGPTGGVAPFLVVGLAGTVLLLRGLLFARSFRLSESAWWVQSIRFVADGTFPIYVLHLPLLVFFAACVPYDFASTSQKLGIFLTIMLIGVAAGRLSNRLRNRLRALTHTFALGSKPEPGT